MNMTQAVNHYSAICAEYERLDEEDKELACPPDNMYVIDGEPYILTCATDGTVTSQPANYYEIMRRNNE